MLLAGADPIEAVKIQLVVIYMLVASTTITMLVGTVFAYRSFFNRDWQLT
jgi:putative ABC transport system permease protein